jgi:hypothetical protein
MVSALSLPQELWHDIILMNEDVLDDSEYGKERSFSLSEFLLQKDSLPRPAFLAGSDGIFRGRRPKACGLAASLTCRRLHALICSSSALWVARVTLYYPSDREMRGSCAHIRHAIESSKHFHQCDIDLDLIVASLSAHVPGLGSGDSGSLLDLFMPLFSRCRSIAMRSYTSEFFSHFWTKFQDTKPLFPRLKRFSLTSHGTESQGWEFGNHLAMPKLRHCSVFIDGGRAASIPNFLRSVETFSTTTPSEDDENLMPWIIALIDAMPQVKTLDIHPSDQQVPGGVHQGLVNSDPEVRARGKRELPPIKLTTSGSGEYAQKCILAIAACRQISSYRFRATHLDNFQPQTASELGLTLNTCDTIKTLNLQVHPETALSLLSATQIWHHVTVMGLETAYWPSTVHYIAFPELLTLKLHMITQRVPFPAKPFFRGLTAPKLEYLTVSLSPSSSDFLLPALDDRPEPHFPLLKMIHITARCRVGLPDVASLMQGWCLPALEKLHMVGVSPYDSPAKWRIWAADMESTLARLKELSLPIHLSLLGDNYFRLMAWPLIQLQTLTLSISDFGDGVRDALQILGADKKGRAALPQLRFLTVEWTNEPKSKREDKSRIDYLLRLCRSRDQAGCGLTHLVVRQNTPFAEDKLRELRQYVSQKVDLEPTQTWK